MSSRCLSADSEVLSVGSSGDAVFALLPAAMRPAPGPLHIIGRPRMRSCIAGAVSLPPKARAFRPSICRAVRSGARRMTIAGIEQLGARRPRRPSDPAERIFPCTWRTDARRSCQHELGLDADVDLDMRPTQRLTASERDSMELPSVVRPDCVILEPTHWSPRVMTLLHMAAGLPEVGPYFGQSRDQEGTLPS